MVWAKTELNFHRVGWFYYTTAQKYQYDAAGRMVKVRNANNLVLATYTYGASNQRLIAQAGDEQSSYRTYYAWGGDAVVAEYSETPSQPTSPQWTKSYVYLGARLLATLTPSGTSSELIQYHHPDRLGTRLVTNASDTNSFEQVSLPFGTALDAESSGATNRRFTSYDRSSVTGLDYAVNRHYDSQQGRFTSVDPIGAGASSLDDPQSWNLYAYVGNDPVNRLDPDGLFWGKIGRFFKSVGKAIVKVLSNKWVQLAIGIALIAVTLFLYSPVMFALTTGIETSSRVGIGIKILHGVLAGGLLVGQVANALQGQEGEEVPDDGVIVVNTTVRGPWWDFQWQGFRLNPLELQNLFRRQQSPPEDLSPTIENLRRHLEVQRKETLRACLRAANEFFDKQFQNEITTKRSDLVPTGPDVGSALFARFVQRASIAGSLGTGLVGGQMFRGARSYYNLIGPTGFGSEFGRKVSDCHRQYGY